MSTYDQTKRLTVRFVDGDEEPLFEGDCRALPRVGDHVDHWPDRTHVHPRRYIVIRVIHRIESDGAAGDVYCAVAPVADEM